MRQETETLVKEHLDVFQESGFLTHKQRVSLFQLVTAFLYCYVVPSMLEKTISCMSVHAVAQAFVALSDEDDTCITVSIEPSESESS